MYLENVSPRINKILSELKEKIDFPYSKTHLSKLLKRMGFHKEQGGEKGLYQQLEIIVWRERYLRRTREIHGNNPESHYISVSHTRSHVLSVRSKPVSYTMRLVSRDCSGF